MQRDGASSPSPDEMEDAREEPRPEDERPATPPPPPGGWLPRLAPLVPGFLLGLQLGGLLFFLNPQLDFDGATVARVVLLYGVLLALGAGLPLALLLRRRPARALRSLPWTISAALGLAAILHAYQASHFAYYLPPGINVRLIKAAVFLGVAALVVFYTALLHSLQARPYGVRSRIGIWLLAVASIYVLLERRDAFEPRPEIARPTSFGTAPQPRLLVVGIDTLTLDAVLPMTEQGTLPFLEAALQEGAYGRLEAFTPVRPATLWTTVSTGKWPYKHGVLGSRTYSGGPLGAGQSLRQLPAGIGFARWGVPWDDGTPERGGRERQVRALWEVLPQLGLSSGVLGWPATSPVAEGPTYTVSDRFFEGEFTPREASPPEVADRARIFRVGIDELDLRFGDRFGNAPPTGVLKARSRDVWRETLAGFLARQAPTDALFLHLPGLEAASRESFGGYEEKRFAPAHSPEHDRAALLLSAYSSQLDAFLASLWEATPDPKLLVVVSAYGVEPLDSLERFESRLAGESPLGGRVEEGADGALILLGEGVRPGTLLTRARLVDVMPTLVYGLGLPVARDLDGRILSEAFSRSFLETHPVTFVPSYETLEPLVEPSGAPVAPAPQSP